MTPPGSTHEAPTPDREELDEVTECFECGAVIAAGSMGGLAVTEGIVLCQDCCVRRGGHYDRLRDIWVMPPWFEDLAGKEHHT